jgi:hypothetical protein
MQVCDSLPLIQFVDIWYSATADIRLQGEYECKQVELCINTPSNLSYFLSTY